MVFATISKERSWSAGAAKDMKAKELEGGEDRREGRRVNFITDYNTVSVTGQVTVLKSDQRPAISKSGPSKGRPGPVRVSSNFEF